MSFSWIQVLVTSMYFPVMGSNSKIEWTDHTFNPWWGCAKISAACDRCYADSWAAVMHPGLWGPNASRRTFGEKHWNEPRKWNRQAAKFHARFKVFCASMSDVFEDRRDLDRQRARLWDLIMETPNLDWLLLTKRPHKIGQLVPWSSNRMPWPRNVWLGTSLEQQRWVGRVNQILEHDAAVHFLSMEPLLERVDAGPLLKGGRIDWVIVGGETGIGSRPMNVEWVRSVRDQCVMHDVPFFFKQWGDYGIDGVRRKKQENGKEIDGRIWTQFP